MTKSRKYIVIALSIAMLLASAMIAIAVWTKSLDHVAYAEDVLVPIVDNSLSEFKYYPSDYSYMQLNRFGGMLKKTNNSISVLVNSSTQMKISSPIGSSYNDNIYYIIPTSITNGLLDVNNGNPYGYGWGINNNCYNYIDFNNKKYVQNVARINLGSLTWYYQSNGGRSVFQTYDAVTTMLSNTKNLLCVPYTTTTASNYTTDDLVVGTTSQIIFIRDESFNGDAVSFKNSLDGVYLYYQLASPIEIDLSSAIDYVPTFASQNGSKISFVGIGSGNAIPTSMTFYASLDSADLDYTEAYLSGYTNGYNSGYDLGSSDGATQNYDMGYAQGAQDAYNTIISNTVQFSAYSSAYINTSINNSNAFVAKYIDYDVLSYPYMQFRGYLSIPLIEVCKAGTSIDVNVAGYPGLGGAGDDSLWVGIWYNDSFVPCGLLQAYHEENQVNEITSFTLPFDADTIILSVSDSDDHFHFYDVGIWVGDLQISNAVVDVQTVIDSAIQTATRNRDEYWQGYYSYGQGYQDIYNSAYNTGYNAGYNHDSGEFASKFYTLPQFLGALFDVPVKVIISLLDINVFGFNLKNFAFSLLTLAILFSIIRLILLKVGGNNE